MIYWIEQTAWLCVLGLVITAVGWELWHLWDWWAVNLSGDMAHALRKHTYDYCTWLFGTDFGWKL